MLGIIGPHFPLVFFLQGWVHSPAAWTNKDVGFPSLIVFGLIFSPFLELLSFIGSISRPVGPFVAINRGTLNNSVSFHFFWDPRRFSRNAFPLSPLFFSLSCFCWGPLPPVPPGALPRKLTNSWAGVKTFFFLLTFSPSLQKHPSNGAYILI